MRSTPPDLNTTQRDQCVRKIILLEGLANVVVLLAKVVVGLSTGSFAVLGDAIHSLTDAANNVVALVVVRIASTPPDREHPYGHRKVLHSRALPPSTTFISSLGLTASP